MSSRKEAVDIVEYIDKALRMVDGLEKIHLEIFNNNTLSKGKKFDLYQLTTELRETLIAIRVLTEKSCRNNEA